MLTKQLNAPKMTFPRMFFYILQRHLYRICSPESSVFHHEWYSNTPEDGVNEKKGKHTHKSHRTLYFRLSISHKKWLRKRSNSLNTV